MSPTTIIIIAITLSLASATRHACDEDATRALKRPWAPVVFHGERETESLPEIDARFTPDGHADEAAGFLKDMGFSQEDADALATAVLAMRGWSKGGSASGEHSRAWVALWLFCHW